MQLNKFHKVVLWTDIARHPKLKVEQVYFISETNNREKQITKGLENKNVKWREEKKGFFKSWLWHNDAENQNFFENVLHWVMA